MRRVALGSSSGVVACVRWGCRCSIDVVVRRSKVWTSTRNIALFVAIFLTPVHPCLEFRQFRHVLNARWTRQADADVASTVAELRSWGSLSRSVLCPNIAWSKGDGEVLLREVFGVLVKYGCFGARIILPIALGTPITVPSHDTQQLGLAPQLPLYLLSTSGLIFPLWCIASSPPRPPIPPSGALFSASYGL